MLRRIKLFSIPLVCVIGACLLTFFGNPTQALALATPDALKLELFGSPTYLTEGDEAGNWEYIYDVVGDGTESQFARWWLRGFDMSQIVNQTTVSWGGVTGTLMQKWDDSIASNAPTWERAPYGSYSTNGTTWELDGHAGEIHNDWHTPDEYVGGGGGGFGAPKFVYPGQITGDGVGTPYQAYFPAKVTSSALYDGILMTLRIVHPNAPGTATFEMYSFNNGGTTYAGTVVGPGDSPGQVCGIGDADCDGDVDLDDIIAAVGSFTGPCTHGVDCFGDPGNGASIYNKIRADGDVNDRSLPITGVLPLQSDGDVDLDDIIDMVGAFTGPLDSEEFSAASAGDPGLPDLIYNPVTGEVFLDGTDIGGGLQAYNIKNAGGGILNGNFTSILGGPPATNLSTEIGEFQLSSTPTPPGGLSIGNVFPIGMDQAALEAFVTGGSAAPSFGGGSFAWELIALGGSEVPEPATVTLLGMGLLGLALVGYRRRR